MLSFVVAIGPNGEIGYENKLPWHLPNDLKRFKDITSSGSRTMIMGRKTFESLPMILPGRKHIVLTRDKEFKASNENVIVAYSLEEVLASLDREQEYFIIGGGEIFKLTLPIVDRMYLTIVSGQFKADTYFLLPDYEDWEIIEEIRFDSDDKNEFPHVFLTLDRKRR